MRYIRFNRHTVFSSVLNVIGLTLALSVFLILTVQVMYDWRYDRCYAGHEDIYRLECSGMAGERAGNYLASFSRPMIEEIRTSLPQAEAVGTYLYYKDRSEPMREVGSNGSGVSVSFADCDYGRTATTVCCGSSPLNLPRGIPPFSGLPIRRSFPRGERPGFLAESPRSGNTWSSPPRTCSGTEPRRASLSWGCTGIFPRTPVWTRSCSSISAITT